MGERFIWRWKAVNVQAPDACAGGDLVYEENELMIDGFMVLLLFQMLGEAVAHLAHWPIPGPIIGLLLMLVWSGVGGKLGESSVMVARGLMSNLGLMFVPVSAGILFQLRSLGDDAWHVVWIVVVATAVTLLVTAATFTWLNRLNASREAP